MTQLTYVASPMTALTLTDRAAAIKSELRAIRITARMAVEHAVNAGQLLIEVKAKIPHGQWLPWLEANCDLSERSAQGYMSLARRWEIMTEKRRDEVALLGLREALKETASRRLPPAKQQVVDVETVKAEMVEAGIAVSAEPRREAVDVDFAIVENKPDIAADAVEEPPRWTNYLAFTESDPKRKKIREKWRSTGYVQSDIAIDVEDAEWLIKLLQWRIQAGHYNGGAV